MTATADPLQVPFDDAFSANLALTLPAGVNPSSAALQSPLKRDAQAQLPPRHANAAAEIAALVTLATALGEAPHTVCQILADSVLALLKAGSAGVSVLSVQSDGGALVSWPAIAGRWQARSGSSRLLLAPAAPAPTPEPAAEHHLVVPFGVAGKTAGTVWAVAHDAALGFDAADLRQLQNLALFAAPAVQAVAARGAAPPPRQATPAPWLHGTPESQHASFNNLIENAPFGVYVVDAQFRLCRASAAAHKAFASVQPLIGRNFGDVVRAVWPEPFASEVLAHFRRTLDSGEAHAEPTLSELRKDTPDVESYDWKIERIVLPDGAFGVVCYFYDLTEREQAAEALRRRTAQFETLFNSAPLGICLVDADLRICQVNPQALPEFGNIEGLIGQDLAAVLQAVWGPARAADIVQQFRHTLNTGEPFQVEEMIAVRVDRGTTACYEWQIHRIPLRDGSHGVVCHFREISKRVQAQAQLRDSEVRFRALVSASSDVVFRMNEDWTEMRHLQGREFIADTHEPNRSWLEKYIQPCDRQRVIDTIREAVRTKGLFELEHQILRIDGTPGWTFSRAIPLMDKDGAVVEWFGMASDVTARKQAQEALRESEQKYRALFESMDEGYCVIEMIFDADQRPVDYRFLEVNPAFEKHTGLRNSQGRRIQELAPDQEAHWCETYGRVALTGEPIRFVNEAKALDGRWFDVYAFRLGGNGSRTVAVLFNDISARKAGEDALRASESRSRTILESITDGFYALDADWRITYFNAAAEQYLDRNSGDLIGKILWDEFPGAVGSEFEQMYRRVASGQGSESIKAHYPDFDRWYDVAAYPASGGLSVYFRDVTDSMRIEELLRASEERQRLALDAAELGMWHVDPATRITRTDARFRAIFGTTEEWTDYLQLFAVMHPDDLPMVQEAVAAATRLEDPVPYAIEYRIAHPDGSLRWVFAKGRSSIAGTGPTSRVMSFDGTVADITSRKAVEADLIAALAAAEDANQAKSDFLSRMSHELRSPLNAVLGFAQLLQSGTPPPTERQEESVDEILKAGWYLLGLIDEILDLSLIESGRLSCVLEPVPLAEVLADCLALVEGQAAARGIRLSLAQLDDACIVIVDRTRLKQVFINLLGNAIKYNRQGGTVQLHFEAVGPGRICIRIEDSGGGLSPGQLDHIFQLFERLGQEAGAIAGTGIGLALSKRLVELMGGRIGVHSVVGQGSVFWVELDAPGAPTSAPASSAETTAARPRVAAAPGPAAARRRPSTVLCVEDNRANQLLVQRLLARRSDVRLLLAGDGQHGVQLARAMQPDVVLMDINLPDMSGLEAMERLAADAATARIPVIAVSALAMRHDIDKGLQAGFFRYLSKPIKIDELTEALDAALTRTNPPEEPTGLSAQPAPKVSSAKKATKDHAP